MVEWWSAQDGNLIGAIGGSALGVLAGGLGAMIGVLAPRGRGRRVIVPAMVLLTLAGGLVLLVGLGAVLAGQPYHVFFPLLLCGGILLAVMGPLIFTVRSVYQRAEQNRMGAAELRRT